jgi:hypothetical protein
MEGVHNYEETVKHKPTQWPTSKKDYVAVIQEVKQRKVYYYKIIVSLNVTLMQP